MPGDSNQTIKIDQDALHESTSDLDEAVDTPDEEDGGGKGTEKFAEAEEETNSSSEKSKQRVRDASDTLKGATSASDAEDTAATRNIGRVDSDPRVLNRGGGGNDLARSLNNSSSSSTPSSNGSSARGASTDSSQPKKMVAAQPTATTPSGGLSESPSPAASSTPKQMTPAATPQPTVQQMPQPVAPPQAMQNPPAMQSYTPQYAAPTQQELMTQNQGAGSQQPADMVSLTPEQMRILAEYLANKGSSGGGGGGDGEPERGGDLSLDGITGDFQEAVLELCDRTVAADIPYAWGGGALDGPSQGITDGGGYADQCGDYNKIGFDCSGLARFVIYQTTGIEIPRTAAPQYDFCTPTDNPQIGDLGWPPGGNPGHVVIYVGDGQVCEAQQSGTNIMFSDDRGFVYGYVPGGPNDPNASGE